MLASAPFSLADLPVADGSVDSPAERPGSICWSSVAKTQMVWDGAAWRVLAVPHSLNTIRAGQVVTIPAEHNLLVVGSLDIQGDGVLDAQGFVIEVS